MEGSLRYDRIDRATESQRHGWMPPRRRDRITKKLVAECLGAIAAIGCCCGSYTRSTDGTEVEDDEKAIAV